MTVTAQTGRSLPRSEDLPLLTGAAKFTADIDDPILDNAYHVGFVRSDVAAGTIVKIETEAALEMPGVVAVVTGADIGQAAPFALQFGAEFAQPLLASDTVRFAGQVVAVVVAHSAAQAADAIETVFADIVPTDPILDLNDAVTSWPVPGTEFESGSDNASTPFEQSDIVVSVTQTSPRQIPAPIEGRAVAASMHAGRLIVWAATQTPHAYKDRLGSLLAIDPGQIRVTAPAVGGGFGGKVSRTAEEYLVPLLAYRLGHPIRWNETRSEYFATATQGRGEQIEFTLAGTSDGQITALRSHLIKDGGAYPLVGVMLAEGYTSKIANGCYDINHVEFSSIGVCTNRPPTSAYRGAGRSSYIAGLERTIDIYANRIGIDPVEVRRRNLIQPGQMPYHSPTEAVYDEADYPADLEKALQTVGYEQLRADQAQRREQHHPKALGIGVACYNHMTTGGGGEEAQVTVLADGSAVVITGTTSQGHGHATTWAQIASDVLGINLDRITVIEGDTDAIASGVGAVGSRSLQTAGMAIHRAATEVVYEARQLAAQILEAAVDDMVLSADGTGFHVIGTPARSISWGETVQQAPADEVTCGDFYDTEGRNTFPSGTHVAVVEVDTQTGLVQLRRLVAVDDAGTLVNPMIVEGQIHGGVASAIGHVLGEIIQHDELGNQVTSSLMDYALPTADQLPSYETVASPTASSFNTLGFKGVGESGTVGATGAVHNAVIDALHHLGVTHIDLPCTPERVWRAISATTNEAG